MNICILISHLKPNRLERQEKKIECMQTALAELKGGKKSVFSPEAYILHEIQLDKWPFQNSATKISRHSPYMRGSILVLYTQTVPQFPLNESSLFLCPLCSILSSSLCRHSHLWAYFYLRKFCKKAKPLGMLIQNNIYDQIQ